LQTDIRGWSFRFFRISVPGSVAGAAPAASKVSWPPSSFRWATRRTNSSPIPLH